ncbi:MAG: Fic family protein [Candidatus Brocadiales bacterium]
MHVEIRTRGKKKLYYIAHSFRDNGKVRKVRRYLGADLSDEKIRKQRKDAENAIREQIENYMRINDPLRTVLSSTEIKSINDIIKKSDLTVRHLSADGWKRFTEAFTYDTNAIEGSTVTEIEVKNILEKDEWPSKRTKEEISETYGVAEAIDYIRKTKDHVSTNLIKKLHKIVFKNSKSFAGNLRGPGIEVVVADSRGNILHRGVPQKHITKLLRELADWYNENKKRYHPIVLAAVVHNQFENIHPFQDGNGRVGRLILNNILIKHGLPPLNIELENRFEYYSTLRAYQRDGNLRPTIEFMLREYGKSDV